MTPSEIRQAFSQINDKMGLLLLLNRIKADKYGENGHPFTISQLTYFANSKRNEASYRSFLIAKKSGGYRIIFAPTTMLKSMLQCLNILLQALYDPAECVMGFRKGHSVADNATAHVERLYVFNSDIKDFFPSITKQRVRTVLRREPFLMNEQVADLICNLCCTRLPFKDGKPAPARAYMTKEEMDMLSYKDVVPQGAPTSPVISNIICMSLDKKLTRLARRYRCRYTRYADDITFSSDHSVFSPAGEFCKEFRRIVEEECFRINEDKTRLQKAGSRQEVTGLVVGEKVNVPKEYIRDISSLLHIWEKYGYNHALLKFMEFHHESYFKFSPSGNTTYPLPLFMRGKLNYLRMIKGENDRVYQKLNERFHKLTVHKKLVTSAMYTYSASFRLDEFEQIIGGTIRFERIPNPSATNEVTLDRVPYAAYFSMNGSTVRAYISHNCYDKYADIISDLNPESDEQIKKKLHISICENTLSYFWLITEGRPYSILQKLNHETRCIINELGLEPI